MLIDNYLRGYVNTKDDELFVAKVYDCFNLALKAGKIKFLGFLDEKQKRIADIIAKSNSFENYYFFGGYEGSERTILGVFPDNIPISEKAFPVSSVLFTFRKQDSLSHRDFLGAIMSLMINRVLIGDIIVSDGNALVYVMDYIADDIVSKMEKVGRTGVKAELFNGDIILSENKFEDIAGVIASKRLDCVVSLVVKKSRDVSSKLIKSKLVSINSSICDDVSKTVCESDKLSIRGYGKFIIEKFGDITKKGRQPVLIKKCI